jgi:hypothetical protein
VFFGVITDRRLVPEPHDIIERFRPEFEKLVSLSLMIPVNEPDSPRLAEELVLRY